MSIIEGLSKLVRFPVKNIVPYVRIQGYINAQKSYQLIQNLNSIPKSSKKIAVIINSSGGQPAQALLIADRLRAKSKECNAQIFTFSEQFALNSAFYLLSQGNKVYVDKSTFVGGLEVGVSKQNYGLLNQYITKIVYSQKSSYFAQLRSTQSIKEQKKEEMKEIFKYFSQQMKNRIMHFRKFSSQVDLKQIYFGEQAQKLRIVDGLGRINQIIPNSARVQSSYLAQTKKKAENAFFDS